MRAHFKMQTDFSLGGNVIGSSRKQNKNEPSKPLNLKSWSYILWKFKIISTRIAKNPALRTKVKPLGTLYSLPCGASLTAVSPLRPPAAGPFWRPGCPSSCWPGSSSRWRWPSTCGDLGEASRGHGWGFVARGGRPLASRDFPPSMRRRRRSRMEGSSISDIRRSETPGLVGGNGSLEVDLLFGKKIDHALNTHTHTPTHLLDCDRWRQRYLMPPFFLTHCSVLRSRHPTLGFQSSSQP